MRLFSDEATRRLSQFGPIGFLKLKFLDHYSSFFTRPTMYLLCVLIVGCLSATMLQHRVDAIFIWHSGNWFDYVVTYRDDRFICIIFG